MLRRLRDGNVLLEFTNQYLDLALINAGQSERLEIATFQNQISARASAHQQTWRVNQKVVDGICVESKIFGGSKNCLHNAQQ